MRRLVVAVAALAIAAPALAEVWINMETPRTFAPKTEAYVRASTRNVANLHVRLYRVDDPIAFFSRQGDVHRVLTANAERHALAPELLQVGLEGWRTHLRHQMQGTLNFQTRTAFVAAVPREEADTAAAAARLPAQRLTSPYPPIPEFALVREWDTAVKRTSQYEWSYDQSRIELGDTLAKGVYLIEAYSGTMVAYTCVIVSDAALVAKRGEKSLVCFVSDARTGERLPDFPLVAMTPRHYLARGGANSSGVFTAEAGFEENAVVFGMRDSNFVISDPSYWSWGGDKHRVYVYTDRPVYRPGQVVYWKAIVRDVAESRLVSPSGAQYPVIVEDPHGDRVYSDTLTSNEVGTISDSLVLGPEPPTGMYWIRVVIDDDEWSFTGDFEVREYKKPEYRVTVETPDGPFANGDRIDAAVSAEYFFGEPVSNGTVEYSVTRTHYYRPWWSDSEFGWYMEEDYDWYWYDAETVAEGEGSLKSDGRFSFSFTTLEDEGDYRYRIEARVVDPSRRVVAGAKTVLVTQGSFQMSLRTESYVVEPGKKASVSARVIDFAEKPMANVSVEFKAVRREWRDAKWQDVETQTGSAATNKDGRAAWSFTPGTEGSWLITARAADPKGREVSDDAYVWATGRWSRFTYTSAEIEITPDKDVYAAGDVARVLIACPVQGPDLFVTVETGDVVWAQTFSTAGSPVVVAEFKVTDQMSPNCRLSVSYVKDHEYLTAAKELIVPPTDRALKVTITADRETYHPQEEATFTVKTTDSRGKGVPAEVSLAVVDEAIYSIVPDATEDVFRFFYKKRYSTVETMTSLEFSFDGYGQTFEHAYRLGYYRPPDRRAMTDFKRDGLVAARIRREFKDQILWVPHLQTNGGGVAKVKVRLPDNLTTWRATARAVDADTRAGQGTGSIICRKDLLVRMETPRYLVVGDTVTITTTVHNYLGATKTAHVSLEARDATVRDAGARTHGVPSGEQFVAHWTVAADRTGTALLTAHALTDQESDALELPIPVIPYGVQTAEAQTAAATRESDTRAIAFHLPDGADRATAQLTLNVSPSAASTMLGSLESLADYPYGCVEQTMSRFLPTVIVANTLRDLPLPFEDYQTEVPKMAAAGIQRLANFQHWDGGWGWWTDDETHPYMTTYVMYGLTLARRAGYAVSERMFSNGMWSIREQYANAPDATTKAFMLYVLALNGEDFRERATTLYGQRNLEGGINDYARAYLALALDAWGEKQKSQQLAGELESRAVDTGTGAHWSGVAWHYNWEDDAVETTAMSLSALANLRPRSDRIPGAVRWLSAQKTGSYWRSTKTTAIAVLGLVEYLKNSSEMDPDYTCTVSVNGKQVLTRRYTHADMQKNETVITVPASDLHLGDNSVSIEKHGRGVLYVSGRLSYYSTERPIPAQAAGFSVSRTYQELKIERRDNEFVYVPTPFDGVVESGELLLVTVEVGADSDVEFAMVEDPIPPGCEVIEDDRGYVVEGVDAYGGDWYWEWWYAHRDVRDRVVAYFITEMYTGDQTFTYLMRAQIPGVYHVMPTVASLMYYPEVRGNSADATFRILD